MKYCLLTLLILILTNCGSKESVNANNYHIVDFKKALKKEIGFNEISDSLKFTFLQYDKQNPVGEILKYKITKNYLVVVDQQHKLFVFKRNGNLVSVIDDKGKGPSEYINIEDFIIDSNEKFIIVLDPKNEKILKYDIHGDYIKSYSMNYTHAAHISNLTNGNYCVYQSARFSEENFNIFILNENFQLINSIIDSKGAILKESPYLLDVNWYNYNNNTYYKEVLGDTVFKITQKNASEPHMLFDIGEVRMPDKYYTKTGHYQKNAHKFYQVGKIIESKNYAFIHVVFNNKNKYFLYYKNKKTEYIDDNETMHRFIDPIELQSRLKSIPKTEKIKKILKSNDNPVLLSGKLLN